MFYIVYYIYICVTKQRDMKFNLTTEEFKTWCKANKEQLKNIDILRIVTFKRQTAHNTLQSFGTEILALEKQGLKSIGIRTVTDTKKLWLRSQTDANNSFLTLLANNEIECLEFSTSF